jgi:predicted small secreted protein
MLTTRQIKLLTILIAVNFSLAACNDGVGSSGVGCPPLAAYSVAEQKEAAAEIRRNPNGQLAKMVRDYGKFRKACRIN